MSEQQKAAKVLPPPSEPEIIEVDMTSTYTVMGVLTVAVVGLTGTTAFLWRKTRVNAEYLEAIREYVSRLVTETDCGNKAYRSIVDGATGDDVVDVSDHTTPVPDDSDREEDEESGIIVPGTTD